MLLSLFLMVGITHADELNIGVTGDNPPFSMRTDMENHFSGFDVELMDQICSRLQTMCHYKAFVLVDLYAAVKNGSVDLAISSIDITPERLKEYVFSLPYLTSNVQFITNIGSSINIPDDIKGKKIGVHAGSPFGDFIKTLYRGSIQLVTFSTVQDLLAGLSAKKVDVIMLPRDAARYWYSNNSSIYKLVGTPIPFGSGYGIMITPSKTSIKADINKALLNMESDGTYLNLYTRYFSS